MSLSRFHKETDGLRRDDKALTLEQASEIVRDRWIMALEYYALVAAILGNWTSGNCVPFMLPVSTVLLKHGELDLHHQLWARSIKRQINTFFREYSHLRALGLSAQDLLATNSSGFNEFDMTSYSNKHLASAFLLKRLLSDLSVWRDELFGLSLSTVEVDQIIATLNELKKPVIKLDRLTPNNSFKPNPLRGSA